MPTLARLHGLILGGADLNGFVPGGREFCKHQRIMRTQLPSVNEIIANDVKSLHAGNFCRRAGGPINLLLVPTPAGVAAIGLPARREVR